MVPLVGNPLAEAHRRTAGLLGPDGKDRASTINRYGFSIPNDQALQAIVSFSPTGVVEVGAGTGYWSRLLYEHGVDVVAYDLAPPPSASNRWFADSQPWYWVHPGDETVVERHHDRTLLIVWPTRNDTWAARALERFHHAGGQRFAYVGEGPGGRTGDDSFHALLGAYDRCWTCAYGVGNAPCICGIPARWYRRDSVELPHWRGLEDDLHLYDRIDE